MVILVDFISVSNLDGVRWLQESRMSNKSNIIDLQFKFFATHVGLGGQDGRENDIREAWRRNKRQNKINEQSALLNWK